MEERGLFPQIGERCLYGCRPPLGHRIRGIHDEVRDNLFKLDAVAVDRRDGFLEFQLCLYLLVDKGPLKKLDRILYDLIKVHRDHLDAFLPGEAQKLRDHLAGPSRRILDGLYPPQRNIV